MQLSASLGASLSGKKRARGAGDGASGGSGGASVGASGGCGGANVGVGGPNGEGVPLVFGHPKGHLVEVGEGLREREWTFRCDHSTRNQFSLIDRTTGQRYVKLLIDELLFNMPLEDARHQVATAPTALAPTALAPSLAPTFAPTFGPPFSSHFWPTL